MKRIISVGLAIMLFAGIALAGGIWTNTNQSAHFIRTLNRNASTCLDAVYFNPAGLTKLGDGIYLHFSNQSIFQTREVAPVTAGMTYTQETYVGDVAAPLFPDFYAVYKSGNLAVGAGFMPIGGGGSADYADGLPSFEEDLADNFGSLIGIPASYINPALAAFGNTTGYTFDVEFAGSSVYFGGQVVAAYAINDMISVAAGGRYTMATNTYEGGITGLAINTDSGMDITSDHLGGALEDKDVDVTQSGSGFNIIAGVNLAPMDGLNVGVRFETLTAMDVENETTVDSTGMFPDGVEVNQDMPAMLGLGVSYMIMENLKAELSFNYYMNTGVGRFDDIMDATNPLLELFGLPTLTIDDFVENAFEFGVGVEYGLSEALKVSAGFLTGPSGRKDMYMADLDFGLASSSIGFGAAYQVSENLGLDIGAVTTMYTEETIEDALGDTDTFNKSNFGIAIGVNYKL